MDFIYFYITRYGRDCYTIHGPQIRFFDFDCNQCDVKGRVDMFFQINNS